MEGLCVRRVSAPRKEELGKCLQTRSRRLLIADRCSCSLELFWLIDRLQVTLEPREERSRHDRASQLDQLRRQSPQHQYVYFQCASNEKVPTQL